MWQGIDCAIRHSRDKNMGGAELALAPVRGDANLCELAR